MRCERELSVFDSKVLRDSTEVATRDIGTGCGCGELPSAVQQYEELFIVAHPSLSFLSSLLPVSPLPGSLLHTESQEGDVAGDGEGRVAEVATAPE